MVKKQIKKIHVLSAVAKDFLMIPLSTMWSESAFTCGRRILGDHRSSLTPEMLEALVCAKDWLFKAKVPEFCSDSEGMPYLFSFAKLILRLSYLRYLFLC